MLLRLENLHYTRGFNFELRLNVNLKTGSRVLLRGSNGSGKTSLLNLLAGIYQPNRGKLVHALLPGSTAMLGHEPFLYPELTVRENLLFWVRMEAALLKNNINNLKELTNEALTRLKLMPMADERADSLSRGMLQRLALGRIFLSRASLILLDEPENGLDEEFFNLLMREILLKSGATIVWASHTLPPNYIFEGQQMFSHCLCLNPFCNYPGVFEGDMQELDLLHLQTSNETVAHSISPNSKAGSHFPVLGDM